MHISDRIKPYTDHVTIGEGFIDFNEMRSILNDVKMDFPLMVEAEKTHSAYQNTEAFLQKAYSDVCKLAELIFLDKKF